MTYVPDNIDVYTAAFSGALAGITSNTNAAPSMSSTASLAGVANAAGAYAEAVDQAWTLQTMGDASALDVGSVDSSSESFFKGRILGRSVASRYATLAAALIRSIQAARNYYETEGIEAPPNGGFTAPTGTGAVTVTADVLDPTATALVTLPLPAEDLDSSDAADGYIVKKVDGNAAFAPSGTTGVFPKTLTAAQDYPLTPTEAGKAILKFISDGANAIQLPAATDALGYTRYVWNVSGGGTIQVKDDAAHGAAATLASGEGALFLVSLNSVVQLTPAFTVA